jgi:hypothetical protein
MEASSTSRDSSHGEKPTFKSGTIINGFYRMGTVQIGPILRKMVDSKFGIHMTPHNDYEEAFKGEHLIHWCRQYLLGWTKKQCMDFCSYLVREGIVESASHGDPTKFSYKKFYSIPASVLSELEGDIAPEATSSSGGSGSGSTSPSTLSSNSLTASMSNVFAAMTEGTGVTHEPKRVSDGTSLDLTEFSFKGVLVPRRS